MNNFCNIYFLVNSRRTEPAYTFKMMIINVLCDASRWQNSRENLYEKILKISFLNNPEDFWQRKMFGKTLRNPR